MAVLSHYLSIIISKANGWNSPIKRHREEEWIKETRSSPTTHFRRKAEIEDESEGMEKIFYVNYNQENRADYTLHHTK